MVVTVIQRVLLGYRRPFFEMLREEMKRRGMELRLVYGQYSEAERVKGDETDLLWGRKIRNLYLGKRESAPVYQPCLAAALRSDLVIVEQASRLLVNYPLQALCPVTGGKLAFWGHGRNFNEERSGSAVERLKSSNRLGITRWFAYTDLSASAMETSGVPRDRITVVNNSIDTEGLRNLYDSVTEEQARETRTRLGLGKGPVGIYCGSLYGGKRIDFLLEAARRTSLQIPGFRLVVAGNGPDRGVVERAASSGGYVRYAGPAFGRDKVLLFAVSDVCLNPGAVGLGILDGFVCRVPLLTTACGNHGPEIAYLENGRNGFITDNTPDAYVACAIELLNDPKRLANLKAACGESGRKYSIRDMVNRFLGGVELALADRGNPA